MPRPVQTSFDARFFLLWVFAGICEAPLLALLIGWPIRISPTLGVLLHFAAAVLVFAAPPPEKGYFKPSRHWGQGLGIMTLLLPGVGWVCAGWLVLRNRNAPYDKEAYIFEDEFEEETSPDDALGSGAALEYEMSDAMDVIPAVDALMSDVPGLQRGAIETLSKIQTAESVHWIQAARSQKDPEVRFYATTALTRIKNEFELAVRAAQKEVYERPEDLDAQISLHRIRFEYASSGLLDPDARTAVLTECRDKLRPLAERKTAAARQLFLIQRELAPDKAFEVLDRLEAMSPERHAQWVRDRAELLFAGGRYADVRALLTAYRKEIAQGGKELPVDRDWRTQMMWWSDD